MPRVVSSPPLCGPEARELRLEGARIIPDTGGSYSVSGAYSYSEDSIFVIVTFLSGDFPKNNLSYHSRRKRRMFYPVSEKNPGLFTVTDLGLSCEAESLVDVLLVMNGEDSIPPLQQP